MKGFLCKNIVVNVEIFNSGWMCNNEGLYTAEGRIGSGDINFGSQGTGVFFENNSETIVDGVQIDTKCDAVFAGTHVRVEWSFDPTNESTYLRLVDACCPPNPASFTGII